MNWPDIDKLRVVYYPDPILKRVCDPVEEFGERLEALAARMFVLMRELRGVGLAAPQVRVPVRLFVCNPTGEPQDDLVCVNPRFITLEGSQEAEEGCLSIPGATVRKRRAARVVMEACDWKGRTYTRVGKDLVARIWQHEADHLDGRLIVDHMSATDEIANRRAVRELQSQYRGTKRL